MVLGTESEAMATLACRTGSIESSRGGGPVAGGDPKDADLDDLGERCQGISPSLGHSVEAHLDYVLPGYRGLQLQGRIEGNQFPWSTMAIRSQSWSASSM